MCIPLLYRSVIAIAAVLGLAGTCAAHPGRTDSNGGHHDRKNGGYHYHNGGSSGSVGSSSFDADSGDFGTASPGYSLPRNQPIQPQKPKYGGYPSAPYVPKGPPQARGGWSDGAPKNSSQFPSQSADSPRESSVGRDQRKNTLKVVGVTDGDTITVLKADKSQLKIRLHGVDAPESHQAFGTKAKQFVSEACFGEEVQLQVFDTDRYGRLVGNVTLLDGRILNHELVKAGMAWWYEQYAKDDEILKALQSQAQAARIGIWSESNPIAPWDFRRGVTTYSEVQPPTGYGKHIATPELAPGAPQTEPQMAEVYITNSGIKYHRSGCRYLAKSMIPIGLSTAKLGYGPCSVCRPPR